MSNDPKTRADARDKASRTRSIAFQIEVMLVGSLMIAALLSLLCALASAIRLL